MAKYVDEQSDAGNINVLSEDVAYAQKHFVINNSDWFNHDTGQYVCMLPLGKLLQLRQVMFENGPVMLILPWANNLNKGRC
eukprot:10281814-Heterocapsa_arctica.AAC.1